MAIVEMAAQTAVRENSDQHLLLIAKTPQKNADMRKKPLTKMYTEGARKRLLGLQMRAIATLKKARLAKFQALCKQLENQSRASVPGQVNVCANSLPANFVPALPFCFPLQGCLANATPVDLDLATRHCRTKHSNKQKLTQIHKLLGGVCGLNVQAM
ncbi:hypothetical protein [Roseateles oligotrophus]|uniref:Uncharacterized protein n=1 Tax=Roseateles oligotrophus TaxID=1769250 RepID=A0ABT2Y8V4_9BURK|nr:hypothetical protein [Roseateles oligotrophus]MCV2366726.1 hypothetical protein [Roseateles oligotrophus]